MLCPFTRKRVTKLGASVSIFEYTIKEEEVPRNKGVDFLMLIQNDPKVSEAQKPQKSERLGQANSQEGRLWASPSQLLLPKLDWH